VNSIIHSASVEFFQPDTVILRCKERANGLYYVLSGSLSVLNEDNKRLRSIRTGGTFGAESAMCELPQVRLDQKQRTTS
jgi:signal-transduction protein with cAMP-binding, CBS, and nucleotidyltransferase domain